ncbi:hypothetical protein POM88_027987 [Heracleum sosnowskyi]|uniref:Uncharacterized protein n=1 Tax=Heracleum sosnowskyi TaxID=360622 RepID=A0AAD8MRJ7_9APIA|nr:hypothetical protein POM88_027987 [Heracleum sosnowskyi]
MKFKDIVVEVANVELYYEALDFFLESHPDLVNDVLNVLALQVDHTCVIRANNVFAVNEALNEISVEEEDYDLLRVSIDLHNNFNQIGLAHKVDGSSRFALFKKGSSLQGCHGLLHNPVNQ